MTKQETIWVVEGNSDFITVREVEYRILRALKTVRVLPDRERRFQKNGQPNRVSLDVIRDYWDAYGVDDVIMPKFKPTPRDISDMLTALSWLRGISKNDFTHLWWRSFDLPFSYVAAKIGRSDETARTRYRDSLLQVWQNAQVKA